MNNDLEPVEPRGTWQGERSASFHEHGIFVAVWILVVLVGTKTMSNMRSIVEPLLWAFFIMMALSPVVDFIEYILLRFTASLPELCRCNRRSKNVLRAHADSIERELSRELSGALDEDHYHNGDAELDEEMAEALDEGCGLQRMIAVLVVLVLFGAGIVGFFVMIHSSAVHMQANWPVYTHGATKLHARLEDFKTSVPDVIADKVTNKALAFMEEAVSYVASTAMELITSMLVELAMMFLYLVFWLCQPVYFGEKVSGVFKRYILLKTVTSFLYGFFVFLVLHTMHVDLAVVFGLVTFVCNFVPEFGPFFAMLLPLPVILFNGRLERPLVNVLLAFLFQLGLKLLIGNIVEVKLVEKQQIMHMHPVTILFFLAYFGWIWGATGMLLCVPIVSIAKATVSVLPKTYRDPFLVFLEGDPSAPARYSRIVEEAEEARSGGAGVMGNDSDTE